MGNPPRAKEHEDYRGKQEGAQKKAEAELMAAKKQLLTKDLNIAQLKEEHRAQGVVAMAVANGYQAKLTEPGQRAQRLQETGGSTKKD